MHRRTVPSLCAGALTTLALPALAQPDKRVRLGIKINSVEVGRAADIELAFKRGAALGARAYTITQGGTLYFHRQAIADRTLSRKVAAMFPVEEFAEAGGLMSYSASVRDNFRHATTYVDKILKSTRPRDISVEQPTRFDLVVNLRTARAMGITFPKAFLAGPDRFIK